MKPIRVVLAALAGGTVMFVWGAISHMLLPIGEMGMRELPAEEAFVPAIREHITESGFYTFPALGADRSAEAMQRWQDKWETGPSGVLIVEPGAREFMPPSQLITEWGADVLAAGIVAVVLGWAPLGLGRRAVTGCALGVFAWLTCDVSYWNWYGFPTGMLLSSLIDQGVGWLAAGAAVALVIGSGRAPRIAAASESV
jgi:hypothetical protein